MVSVACSVIKHYVLLHYTHSLLMRGKYIHSQVVMYILLAYRCNHAEGGCFQRPGYLKSCHSNYINYIVGFLTH